MNDLKGNAAQTEHVVMITSDHIASLAHKALHNPVEGRALHVHMVGKATTSVSSGPCQFRKHTTLQAIPLLPYNVVAFWRPFQHRILRCTSI